MAPRTGSAIPSIIAAHEQDILSEWVRLLDRSGGTGGGRIRDAELRTQCREFLASLRQALASGDLELAHAAGFAAVRDMLSEVSRSRAAQGFSPSETATFVFSLKQPLFERLLREHRRGREALAARQLGDARGCSTSSACSPRRCTRRRARR